MKVAVSTENSQVASHFGRCSQFTIAEINNDGIVSQEVIPNPGHQPGFLPSFLSDKGVECIIAGGMGERAKQLFDTKGIETVVGVEGEVERVIKSYLEGNLAGNDSYCEH